MDKTIELIMVIAVTVVVAGIIIFLVQGEAGSFDDFLDGQGGEAQCKFYLEQGDCDSFVNEENNCREYFPEEQCIPEDGSG